MNIDQLSRKLALIRSGREPYGDGTTAQQAAKFYYTEMLPVVAEALVERTEALRARLGQVGLPRDSCLGRQCPQARSAFGASHRNRT